MHMCMYMRECNMHMAWIRPDDSGGWMRMHMHMAQDDPSMLSGWILLIAIFTDTRCKQQLPYYNPQVCRCSAKLLSIEGLGLVRGKEAGDGVRGHLGGGAHVVATLVRDVHQYHLWLVCGAAQLGEFANLLSGPT